MGYASKNQGYYKPKHPEKYKGNIDNIRFLSSWELHFNKFLDNNPNILEWASEEIVIPYIKPTDGKVHKYYPDYWIKYKDRNGNIIQEIIEVKPDAQTKPPKKRGKKKKVQLRESVTYAINVAKWKHAAAYCKKHGLKFRLITEKQLFK